MKKKEKVLEHLWRRYIFINSTAVTDAHDFKVFPSTQSDKVNEIYEGTKLHCARFYTDDILKLNLKKTLLWI